ncbi:MAG TPA: HD-GYP domain-containing protein [Atribacterota bacterium]|nr:HD-GYP domain-containing protein [Atribacterota bacterium]
METFKNNELELKINLEPNSRLINKLMESEEKYKILFDYAPDGYYISDLKGTFIDANRAAERISGYTCDELLGKNYFQAGLLSIKDVPKALRALAKNKYTAGHQLRVTKLAVAIAQEMNLSPDHVESVKIASQIHDIGKIGIPSEILTKPTNLDSIEFSFIKEHPRMGYNILKDVDFSYPIADIILQHHERNDGSGYPQGITGESIILEAKIIAVADVVEAMTSHRPYRAAMGIDAAMDEILKNKGTLYQPEIVDVCIKLFKEKGFNFLI